MKKLAIMQPYFFPYLGYFQLIYAVDKFVLYDNLNYIKYGWINRNRLLAVKGEPFYFIVPVMKKSSSKKIRDIKIKEGSWSCNLLKSIYMNYKKSEFFQEIFPLLEKIINYKTDSISLLNKKCILDISEFLSIGTDILTDPDFNWLEDELNKQDLSLLDIDHHIESKTSSIKVNRVIEICKLLNAKIFINPIGGINLYPKEEFIENNISIFFLNMGEVRYQQNSNIFYPRLSIIDVLLNCGKKKTFELLNKFILM